MSLVAVLTGALLGVLSRVEETTAGFSIGLSSNTTWLGTAFALGALGRRAGPCAAAATGALALTAANVAYYAWISATQPDLALAAVAGPPLAWFALGMSGGAVFGATGRAWRATGGAARILAALPLAGVCIAEGIRSAQGGPAPDGAGLLVGVALPIASAASARQRLLGGALVAGIVAVALTGRLEPFIP